MCQPPKEPAQEPKKGSEMKATAENVLPTSTGLLVGVTVVDKFRNVRFVLLEIPWKIVPWGELSREFQRYERARLERDEDLDALW